MLHLPKGPWHVDNELPAQPRHLGLLILEGTLTRDVVLGNRTGVELLGPGDVLRPWVRLGRHTSISLEENFTVADHAALAVLDQDFATAVARWPAITSALMDRLALRSRWIAFHLAVCHLRRLDTRVLVVLWYYADRWGRVTKEGVVLPVTMTHRLLASIVGAQRASVSRALKSLGRRRRVVRRDDGSWLLRGGPPPELETVQEQLVGPRR